MADRLDPPKPDAFALLWFVPNAGPQTTFLDAFEERNADLFYGGAAGGGKSAALLAGSLRACVNYPGLEAYWFRESYPNLRRSIQKTLAYYRYADVLGAHWHDRDMELRFDNGSYIAFCYIRDSRQAQDYLSVSMQLLLLDERTQLRPDAVDLLYSRVRKGNSDAPVLGIRSASNPGGIGHAVVKREYIEATEHGAIDLTDEAGRRRSFIQARVSDNPKVDPVEYAKSLSALSPILRQRMLDGDWNIVAGQVFSEWRHDRHVIIPFELPPSWRRFGGIDWGMRHPAAVVWAAEDNDGRLWIYRELHQSGLGEQGLADRITEMNGSEHVIFAFDPSMSRQVGDALPVSTVLQQHGVVLVPAINDRLPGWARVHSYLAEAPACLHHASMGWETCPLMHVFASCTDLIEAVPGLPYAETGNTEDAEKLEADLERGRLGDDLPDALRYLVMQLGATAAPVIYDDRPTRPDYSESPPPPPHKSVGVSPFV